MRDRAIRLNPELFRHVDYKELYPQEVFRSRLEGKHIFHFGQIRQEDRSEFVDFLEAHNFIELDENHRIYYRNNNGETKSRYKCEVASAFRVLVPFAAAHFGSLSDETLWEEGCFFMVDVDNQFYYSRDEKDEDLVDWVDRADV